MPGGGSRARAPYRAGCERHAARHNRTGAAAGPGAARAVPSSGRHPWAPVPPVPDGGSRAGRAAGLPEPARADAAERPGARPRAAGSLLVIPVADNAQHLLANLAFFIQNGYGIYDDINGREIPGQDRFGELLRHTDPFPLSFVEQYSITEASAELMTSTYNGHLVLGGMGLGGWSFDGIDRLTVLGASGEAEVPGLGFRYPTPYSPARLPVDAPAAPRALALSRRRNAG